MSQEKINSTVSRLKPAQSEDTEVPEALQKKRRVWTVKAKLQALKDIEELKGNQADVGAYLRKHGLYSSTISLWKKLRNNGTFSASSDGKRGPKAKQTEEQKEIERLLKENLKLQKELEVSKKLIEIQKKIAELIERSH